MSTLEKIILPIKVLLIEKNFRNSKDIRKKKKKKRDYSLLQNSLIVYFILILSITAQR